MAICVAVIGKDNSPLYIGGSGVGSETELSRQWLVHTALDALEERLSNTGVAQAQGPAKQDLRDLYLGLLFSTDTHKIYGYITNTRIKLVLAASTSAVAGVGLRDNEVRAALKKLHSLYTDAICNPFHLPGESITSPKFDQQVKSLLSNAQ